MPQMGCYLDKVGINIMTEEPATWEGVHLFDLRCSIFLSPYHMNNLHLDFQHYGMVPTSVILRKDDGKGGNLAYHSLNMEFTQVPITYYGNERSFSLVSNGIHIHALEVCLYLVII